MEFERATRPESDLHLLSNNASHHKATLNYRGFRRHPRLYLYFTPTSGF